MKIAIPKETITKSEDLYELPAYFKTKDFYAPFYIAVLDEKNVVKMCNYEIGMTLHIEKSITNYTKEMIGKSVQITADEFSEECGKMEDLINSLKIV